MLMKQIVIIILFLFSMISYAQSGVQCSSGDSQICSRETDSRGRTHTLYKGLGPVVIIE